jgi:hypothetical protein
MSAQVHYWSVVWLLMGIGSLRADAPVVVENNGRARLLVDTPVGKDGITINLADVLTVTLQVDGTKALEVKPPDEITKSTGWRLVEAAPAATTEPAKDCRRWRQRFVFEPLFPGSLPLQIEPLMARDNGAPFQKIAWQPVQIHTTTNITSPDLKGLRDPTFIEPLALPPEPDITLWSWFGGVVLLVLLFALSFFWWRRRARTAPIAAEQRALRELERVLALQLPERGKVARFHGLLANVVRRYLERKYQLPARRRTTREFLEVVGTSEKLSGPGQEFLREFLPLCDFAKFAGADARTPECLDLADKVRAFIKEAG